MRTDSPEDRLLRLIKGKYNKKPETGEIARPAANTESFLTDAAKKVFLQNKKLKSLFSNTVNMALAVILLGLIVYFAHNLIFPAHRNLDYLITKEENEASDTENKNELVPSLPQTENYSVYSKMLGGKDLFTAPLGEGAESRAQVPEVDVSKRFNLVGIISGDEPQAIIEDTEAKKTHYLYKGQSINGVTVREIADGRVVLDYKGREIMLVL